MPVAVRKRFALTLVEVLVALTMTLIVLVSMMSAFRYASQEMQTGRALIELSSRTRTVEDLFRSDIAGLTVEARVHTGATDPNGYLEIIEGPVRDATPLTINGVDSYLGDCDDVVAFTARSNDGVLFRGRLKTVVANAAGNATDMNLNQTQVVESSLAEIVWFTAVNDNDAGRGLVSQQDDTRLSATPTAAEIAQLTDFDDSVRVYRRQLLIRPDLSGGVDPSSGTMLPRGQLANELSPVEVDNFIRNNDISVRVVQGNNPGVNGTFDIFANDLQDLAVRGNRFAHQADLDVATGVVLFPNNLTFNLLRQRLASDDSVNGAFGVAVGGNQWQPLPPLLTDVAAFDIRVYSPNARVVVDNTANVVVEPGDIGYVSTGAAMLLDPGNTLLSVGGAYVDLGYAPGALRPATPNRSDEWFIDNATIKRQVNDNTQPGYEMYAGNVWDSWTPRYERDGINQNLLGETNSGIAAADRQADEGANGIDNGGSSVIDDPLERETTPPYVQPVRALRLQMRLIEKGTKQVHQVSIVHSFVPE